MHLNKSLVVNLLCAGLVVIGHTLVPSSVKSQVLGMGYFGLSGAITNWLAVHMLFERVPGLYGSGIIPLKFEAFKSGIRHLIMNQFFTVENISKFLKGNMFSELDLEPMVDRLDYDRIFEGFVDTVKASKFGGMLGLFGGEKALDSRRDPFARILRAKLKVMVRDPEFKEKLQAAVDPDKMYAGWQAKIQDIVHNRLEELTPQMVKDIIQDMIRSHLGWLVVWGGVFGGVIGLASSFVLG